MTPTDKPTQVGGLIDVLDHIDIEIDAIRLQVERGNAPEHALHDMREVRSMVADLIGQRDELARIVRFVHDSHTRGVDQDSVLGALMYSGYMDSQIGKDTVAILKRVGGRRAHN